MEGVIALLGMIFIFPVAQGTIPPHSPLLIQAGKDAVFRWTTENGNEVVAVSWGLKKDNRIYPQFIYVSKIIPAKNSKKYSFAGNLTIGRAWFILSNVLINETGDYAADIREKGQQAGILHAAHLQVSATPKFIIKPNASTSVIENADLEINCTASGPPKPNVTWVEVGKGGNITTKAHGRGSVMLSEDSIKKGSQGRIFVCQARNNPSQYPVNVTTTITVYYKPTIDKESSNKSRVESWNGHTIKLICNVLSSYPAPKWSWNKRSEIIKTSSSISNDSEILVKTEGIADYGLYSCTATNVAGKDVHFINVTQLLPPGPPSFNVTDIEASSAVVRWTEPIDNGGSKVTGYKVEIDSKTYNITASKPNHFSIPGLTKNKVYVVKLYARNIVGYGNASNKTFTTKKEGPPASPVLKTVKVSPTTVTLSWSKPEENGGEIQHYTVYKKLTGENEWSQVGTLSGEPLTYTVKDLLPGKTYSFHVTAKNKDGPSLKGENAITVTLPVETTIAPTTSVIGKSTAPSKGKSSGGESDPNQPIIIAGAVVAVVLIAVTAVISIVILRKKNAFGKSGKKRESNQQSAAYHNDVDSSDSIGRGAAAVTLNDDSVPTYAAVDMTKKTKKKNEIPNYAAVDKSKKKKKPGEIIYAELADFNTNNVPAGPRPAQYTETDYADISQFQNQVEPEPTYANFPGRSKDYNI